MKTYPLSIYNDRSLPENYRGPVFVWDIDKTYLSTHFSSLGGLLKIPVEFAVDKKTIPGMAEVLRGLRRGTGNSVACQPIYFISASPPQMRSVLENKMLRDGVEQDGFIFKDWLGTLMELRPGRLWEQLGFKLVALLTGRMERLHALEYLFGDDTEQDPLAFSLYAQIIHGKLLKEELELVLSQAGVAATDQALIDALVKQLPAHRGKVGAAFIHLENKTPPEEITSLGGALIPVRGAFQLSLALYNLGLVKQQAVLSTRQRVMQEFTGADIVNLIDDAKRRKLIRPRLVKEIKNLNCKQ